MKKANKNKETITMGIAIVAMGIIFSTTLGDSVGYVGFTLIGLGVVVMGIGLARRKKEKEEENS